jgi:hypothetical protein
MRTLGDKLIDLSLGRQPQQAVLMAWEGTMPDKAPRQCVIEHNAVLRENRFRGETFAYRDALVRIMYYRIKIPSL